MMRLPISCGLVGPSLSSLVCSTRLHRSTSEIVPTVATQRNTDAGASGSSSSQAEVPVPPQHFEVFYERGTRLFTMFSTSPVAQDTVVVKCAVSNRQLPDLHDAEAPARPIAPHPHERGFSRRRVAFPTHSHDELPVGFTVFVGSVQRGMTVEAQAVSVGGALCLDGIALHKGPVTEAVVNSNVLTSSQRYQGPTVTQRPLAEVIACRTRRTINPLCPYRQVHRNFFDPFVNPNVSPFAKYDHAPVHTLPGHVVDSVAAVLAESGVDDQLATFVHKYSWYVQREEDLLWRHDTIVALGIRADGRTSGFKRLVR